MEVRRANHNDIAGILDLLQDYHSTSNVSNVKFVRQDCAKVCDAFISAPDCFTEVCVNDDGELLGLLFGSLQPHFINRRASWASDLFFIANGGGNILLRRFKEWAVNNGAERIVMGVSSGDSRADALIELSGFDRTGGMYVFRG
jgi:hypothetical protein